MTYLEQLKEHVTKLQETYTYLYRRFEEEYSCHPLEVVDSNGYPILLNTLAILVNAETTLAQAQMRMQGN